MRLNDGARAGRFRSSTVDCSHGAHRLRGILMQSDVLLIIGHLGEGGAQKTVSLLANTWAGRGVRVCVATFADRETDRYRLDARVERVQLAAKSSRSFPLRRVTDNLRRVAAIRALIRRTRVPTAIALVAATNVLTVLAAWRMPVRVIISERNDPDRQSHGRVWDFLRRTVYRYADIVTANSQGAVQSLARYVPRQKLALVPNLLERRFTPGASSERRPVVLAVGRLVPQKGFDILLEAFAIVVRSYPGWRLRIAGDGPEALSLRNLARSLELEAHVDWLGHIGDVTPEYAGAAIFVLSSRFEGTPNTLLEAMAAGLPAVVTNASPGPLELIADGKTGFVVPVGDAPRLAEAILQLISQPDFRAKLGSAACAVAAPFDLSTAIVSWDRLIEGRNPEAARSDSARLGQRPRPSS